MKIAVYTITKNEEQFIQRWADSCREADYRLIVDTGSTDNTLQVAELAGCDTAQIKISPWRFDDARNAALALVPQDIDMCVSLDADEILMPGWRDHLESLPDNITRPRYKYVWSWNNDGTEGITFFRDHIHKRHGYRWKHPVHEILIPADCEEVQAYCGLEVHHHPDPTKSRGQYLPLLELAVEEQPDDDRNRFYLGREYMFYNMPEKSIPHFTRHLELSTWDAERAASMRYLAKATGNKEHWLLRACAEVPHRREPWVDLALHYYETKNWPGSLYASLRALGIADKPLEYLCEAEAWGQLPHDLAGIASWNLEMKRRGFLHTIEALKLAPWDGRIRNNAIMMAKEMRKTKVIPIIPSKSNTKGLETVLEQLIKEKSVEQICIVADGEKALSEIDIILGKLNIREKCNLISVKENSGIHKMWNIGADYVRSFWDNYHYLFINDDVTFDDGAIDALAGLLDIDLNVGVVCPNYDNRIISDSYVSVSNACPGLYDGTDGLAGFCFMLRYEIASTWRFDERMKWYYGDNDIVNWVIASGKVAAISGLSTMQTNPSWTKTHDRPKGFDDAVKNDEKIFSNKWTDGVLVL
ncbi:MAG: hypothetical protein RL563_2885 [Pseudomonadota bacterium]